MEKLNPYVISWVILIPTRLRATKHDEKIFGFFRTSNKELLLRHFATPEKAKAWVEEHLRSWDITKPYEAYVITDKQFGMLPSQTKEGVMSVITKKQKNEVKIIKYRDEH